MPGDWDERAITVALEAITRRLEEAEDQIEALRLLPERMAELRATCNASHALVVDLRTAQLRGDDREERRVGKLHEKVDKIDAKLDERFDRIDTTAAATRDSAAGVDWRTVLAVVTGVAVPLAVAIIAASP